MTKKAYNEAIARKARDEAVGLAVKTYHEATQAFIEALALAVKAYEAQSMPPSKVNEATMPPEAQDNLRRFCLF